MPNLPNKLGAVYLSKKPFTAPTRTKTPTRLDPVPALTKVHPVSNVPWGQVPGYEVNVTALLKEHVLVTEPGYYPGYYPGYSGYHQDRYEYSWWDSVESSRGIRRGQMWFGDRHMWPDELHAVTKHPMFSSVYGVSLHNTVFAAFARDLPARLLTASEAEDRLSGAFQSTFHLVLVPKFRPLSKSADGRLNVKHTTYWTRLRDDSLVC